MQYHSQTCYVLISFAMLIHTNSAANKPHHRSILDTFRCDQNLLMICLKHFYSYPFVQFSFVLCVVYL